MELVLLGGIAVLVDDGALDPGPARQRCVLAALAVDAGHAVSVERLIQRVWGEHPPLRARATLLNYLSRLRLLLADTGAAPDTAAVVRRPGGYSLEVEHSAIDLFRFRALCVRARAGDDRQAVALLQQALALWQGEALTGIESEWATAERDRLHQQLLDAECDLTDILLRLGHGEDLVAQLSTRTAQHPLDERVAGQYMLALHRAGRSADALDHYRQLRERLVTELGADPGTALQHLHRQILAADPNLLLPTPADTATNPVVIPRQLPAAPAPFIGRQDELKRLDTAPTTRSSPGSTPEAPAGGMMLITAIGGTGGIGKTWLALHWAHHHLDHFADGQLFIDLHGFSPTGPPANPADVLGRFLEALGVDRDRQPTDPDRRADLYRSLIADKRMLIVLDNAATTDQVTPLLPGGHHCTVLITSRNHLRGLIARHGAHLDGME